MDQGSHILQKIQQARSILLAGLLAFGVFLLLSWLFGNILWEWEQKTVDYRFRLRGSIPIHPAIVHIDIDDESIKALGPWPWKRSLHGELIQRLSEAGVRVQAFDIIFSGEKDQKDDAALVEAVKQAGTVYHSIGFELRPFSGLSLISDQGMAEGIKGLSLSLDQVTGHPEPFYTSRVLGPMTSLGEAAKILKGNPEEIQALSTELNQKLCLISLTATGITDIGPTPFETSSPLNGIHSNTLNTILTQQFLYELSPWTNILVLVILTVLLLILVPFLRPGIYVLTSFLLLVGYTLLVYGLFEGKGLLLNLVNPWLSGSLVVSAVVLTRYRLEEREREQLRSAFALYLSPQLLKQALEHPEGLSLGGKRKELTALFSDIVGFSTLSDKLEPEETQALLNHYFEEMTEIVFRYGGTIDKFIGDGLMALWGDPLPCEDHALRAVKCAVEMQKRMLELQSSW